ncbi:MULTISPECIES: ribokinase [unclassified Rathayibacter]|uniref:ribokinase n=1 Tax=unclassified Rathayibacter TaxID=2609250 RepID=UPI000CE77047|nr:MULTISPECIES: ribokinase [unclassified Rathayibacter]PPF14083.1 ribokinase [Rathayibacter sp. AY1A4]PPG81730.1 ribokinase [Rathayibacter sp. AY1E5]PPH33264.1 ribokinase [Rathayibacter sp. AY1C3]PPH61213.1 ribokinase [Rathayibacter sp. AY1D7]PPI29470.1 ribokinase [Rathayibacter sp. AY1B4]
MPLLVLGSANLDHVHRVARIPAPGETVLALDASTFPGGKGLNQAVAAARTEPGTVFVTSLGRDSAGDRLAAVLGEEPLELRARRGDVRTGTAQITVDERGENAIVVDSGANAALVGLTAEESALVVAADALLLQLEIPTATVTEAARAARAGGTVSILNAAPIGPLPEELLAVLDVLIVNEHEARELAADRGITAADDDALAAALTALVPLVLVTLGSDGVVVAVRDRRPVRTPAFRVEAVDTTGAGDTFCGAFSARLAATGARLDDPEQLVALTRWASAAAAISVTRAGAAVSAPTAAETDAFLAERA